MAKITLQDSVENNHTEHERQDEKIIISKKHFESLMNRVKNSDIKLEKMVQERNDLEYKANFLEQELNQQLKINEELETRLRNLPNHDVCIDIQPIEDIKDEIEEIKLEFTSVNFIKQIQHLFSNF